MLTEAVYPKEENLGRNCRFWGVGSTVAGCCFPKAELQSPQPRTSCEGIVDDVCLYVKNGRRPASLTDVQIVEIKTRLPGPDSAPLPPGGTT